jgi:FkbM family methyltransferase
VRLKNVIGALTSAQHRRAALTMRLFWILRKLGIAEIVVRRELGLFQVSTSDLVVGVNITAHGGYDRAIFFDAVDTLITRNLLNGDVFLDIGANNGFVTVYAMSTGLFRTAVCIEPDPDNFRRLTAAMSLNGYDHVTCVNAGISNARGELRLYRNPDNAGDYRPAPTEVDRGSDWESLVIPVDTLDATLKTLDIAPHEIGFICLDVQGWEGHVLEGAAALLAARVPILLELWPRAMIANGRYEQAIETLQAAYDNFFARIGGEFREVDLAGLLRSADASRDPDFQFDLLCVHASVSPELDMHKRGQAALADA